MRTIQTVTGPLAADALGTTLIHEHLLVGWPGWEAEAPADRAARIVRRGLDRNRGRIAFPWPVYATVRLLAALPVSWIDPLLRRLPSKGG